MLMLGINELIQNNLIPSDVKILNNYEIREKCISLSNFESMPIESKQKSKRLVIANNSIWAATHKRITFSSDGDSVWVTSDGNSTIAKKELVDEDLVTTRLITLISLRNKKNNLLEVHNMENTDLLKSLAEDATEMQQSQQFKEEGTEPKKAEKSEKAKERERLAKLTQDKIKMAVENEAAADVTELQVFNRKNSTLIGYVVGSEPKITASTKSVVKTVNGSTFLTQAGKDKPTVLSAFNNKEKVDDRYLEKQPTLFLKQSNPTTMLAAVMKVPVAGIVADSALRSSEPIKFDKENKDTIVVVRAKDEIPYFITNYLGGSIKEDPLTHAEPGEFIVDLVQAITKDSGAILKPEFKSSLRKKKLFTESNWVPKRRYKTISMKDALAADAAKQGEINKALFSRFFKDGAKGKIYDRFDEASKKKISKDENGVITSTVIAKNAQIPSISTFYDSSKPLTTIAIPTKEFKLNNKGEETSSFIVYDVTKPTEELEFLNPDTAAEFEPFRTALGGKTTITECIKEVAAATNKSKSNSKVIGNTEARILLYKASQNESNIEIKGTMSKEAYNKYKADIASSAM